MVPVSAHERRRPGRAARRPAPPRPRRCPRAARQGRSACRWTGSSPCPAPGVIVTGTCWSGSVEVGDQLLVEPGGAQGAGARGAGARPRGPRRRLAASALALALHGVKKEDLERGYQVLSARRRRGHPAPRPARRPVPALPGRTEEPPAPARAPRRPRGARAHRAAGRRGAGRRRRRRAAALAQLHLEEPLVAARAATGWCCASTRRSTSIAGGTVLDADAAAPPPFRRRGRSAALAVRETGRSGRAVPPGPAGGRPARACPRRERCGRLRRRSRRAAASASALYDRALLERRGRGRRRPGRATTRDRFPCGWACPRRRCAAGAASPAAPAEWNALLPGPGRRCGGWVVVGDRIAARPDGPPLPPALAGAVVQREEAPARPAACSGPALAAFGRDGRGPVAGRRTSGEEEFLRHLVDRGRAVPGRLRLLCARARRWRELRGAPARRTSPPSGELDLRRLPRAERPDAASWASRCWSTWTQTGYTRARRRRARAPGPALEAATHESMTREMPDTTRCARRAARRPARCTVGGVDHRRRRARARAVDDLHPHRRRRGHPAADPRAGHGRRRHRARDRERRGRGRRPCRASCARANVPLVADIHFDHKLALAALEAGVAKLRINPGNIGSPRQGARGGARGRRTAACPSASASTAAACTGATATCA